MRRASKRAIWAVAALAVCSVAVGEEIHEATDVGDIAKLKTLLKAKPDLINAKDRHGQTPLHHAILNHQKAAAELLLTNKADINAQDDFGRTPLHLAVQTESVEMVEFLLVRKADLKVKSKAGKTALQVAKAMGHDGMINLLHKHGAKE